MLFAQGGILTGKLSDEALIQMYRDGSRDSIDELFERYKGCVRRKAHAMYIAGGDEEDLIQEGMIGLYKAVQDYDANREASFATFASMCINRNMCTAVAKSNRKKYQLLNESLSLDMPVAVDEEAYDEPQTHLIDVVVASSAQDPENMYIDKERVDVIYEAIRTCLSEYEKQVLDLYIDGNDYVAIARLLNKQPKSVDNALQRIRSKIRKSC